MRRNKVRQIIYTLGYVHTSAGAETQRHCAKRERGLHVQTLFSEKREKVFEFSYRRLPAVLTQLKRLCVSYVLPLLFVIKSD